MKRILLVTIFYLLSVTNSALFAQGLDKVISNTSPENIEKIEECPKNQILKFSDGKFDCISKTVFYNMNAIQDRLASDEVGQVSFFLNKFGGSLNRIAVTVQPEICPVSQALSNRAAMWGDSIPKSGAIKLCEKSIKGTDSNCNCEDLADVANKRNREEFYKFEIDYLLAYIKKNNISDKGLDHYIRGTNLNKYKPELVASIFSKLNNPKAQTKEADNSPDLNKLQDEIKKLAKELAELKDQKLSKVELPLPSKVATEGAALIVGSDRYAAFSLPSFLNEVKKSPIKTCTINYSKIDNENLNYYLYDKTLSQFLQTELNKVFSYTYQNLNEITAAVTKQQCNLIFLKSIDTVNVSNSLQSLGFKISVLSEKNTQDLLDSFKKSTGFQDYAALKKDEEEKKAAIKKVEEEKIKAEADKKVALKKEEEQKKKAEADKKAAELNSSKGKENIRNPKTEPTNQERDNKIEKKLARIKSICEPGNRQSKQIFPLLDENKGAHAFCWGFITSGQDFYNKTNYFNQYMEDYAKLSVMCDWTDETKAKTHINLGKTRFGFCLGERGEATTNCLRNFTNACKSIGDELEQAGQVFLEK